MLNEFGVNPTDEELQKIVEQQKIVADKGKSITTAELLSISGQVMGNTKFEEKFTLHDFHIVTGLNIIPTAVIQLSTSGQGIYCIRNRSWASRLCSQSDPENSC